tara:strand:+ start:3015 stop:3278 length:264 start_codon:yes stop_codon:yes gene_type:complete
MGVEISPLLNTIMKPIILIDGYVDQDETLTLPFEILNPYVIEVFLDDDNQTPVENVYVQGNRLYFRKFYEEYKYPTKVWIKYITKDF